MFWPTGSPSHCVGCRGTRPTLSFHRSRGVAPRAHSKARARLSSACPRPAKPSHLSPCGFPSDSRCYCFDCVDTLVGPGTSGKVQAMSNWVCFLCLPSPRNGLLQRRRKWRERLKAFYDQDPVRSRSPDGSDCAGGPSFLRPPVAEYPPALVQGEARRLSKGALSWTAGSTTRSAFQSL